VARAHYPPDTQAHNAWDTRNAPAIGIAEGDTKTTIRQLALE
jgi:hypothetical protein